MILSTLTEVQIVDRIALLSEALQIALEDPDTKAFVDEVAVLAGVSPDILPMFETLVSVVLMGFLRPEGLAGEFQELGVDPVTAIAAAEKIAKEIFQPILTEIANANLLPRDVPEPNESSAPGPTLDLKGAPRPAPLPVASTGIPAPARVGVGMATTPTAPKPAPIVASTDQGPGTKDIPKIPKPFMLQKESAAEPSVANSGFKLDIDPKLFNRAAESNPAPMPPPHARPAELELGKAGDKRAEPAAANAFIPPIQRVVHYTDVRGSLGVVPAPAIKPQPAPPPKAAAVPVSSERSAPAAMPAAPEPPSFTAKPAPLPQATAPATPSSPVIPARATSGISTPTSESISISARPSPFSLGVVVQPQSQSPTLVKNAPGVPPGLPLKPDAIGGLASGLKDVAGTTAPLEPNKPPRVVNFAAEDTSVK